MADNSNFVAYTYATVCSHITFFVSSCLAPLKCLQSFLSLTSIFVHAFPADVSIDNFLKQYKHIFSSASDNSTAILHPPWTGDQGFYLSLVIYYLFISTCYAYCYFETFLLFFPNNFSKHNFHPPIF